MDVPRQDLLAGAGFAGDQHGGLGGGDLLGPLDRGEHRRVAGDQRMAFAAGGLQDGGDQIRIGRQRQEFARAVANGAHGGGGVRVRTAGDHRYRHALRGQRAHQCCDIVVNLAEHQIHLRIGTQPHQRGVQRVRLIQLGAARHGDPGRLTQIAGQRTDNQYPQERSAFTISVMVTPRRLSSTITTSPRATRRLLT